MLKNNFWFFVQIASFCFIFIAAVCVFFILKKRNSRKIKGFLISKETKKIFSLNFDDLAEMWVLFLSSLYLLNVIWERGINILSFFIFIIIFSVAGFFTVITFFNSLFFFLEKQNDASLIKYRNYFAYSKKKQRDVFIFTINLGEESSRVFVSESEYLNSSINSEIVLKI